MIWELISTKFLCDNAFSTKQWINDFEIIKNHLGNYLSTFWGLDLFRNGNHVFESLSLPFLDRTVAVNLPGAGQYLRWTVTQLTGISATNLRESKFQVIYIDQKLQIGLVAVLIYQSILGQLIAWLSIIKDLLAVKTTVMITVLPLWKMQGDSSQSLIVISFISPCPLKFEQVYLNFNDQS